MFKICIFVAIACCQEPQEEDSELRQLLVTICTLPAEKMMMMIITDDDNDHDDSAYKDIKEDVMSFHQSQHICITSSNISYITIHYSQTPI